MSLEQRLSAKYSPERFVVQIFKAGSERLIQVPNIDLSLAYMALKWILHSARALVATCLRMVLFYLISFSPNLALALHMHLAEGGLSGGE